MKLLKFLTSLSLTSMMMGLSEGFASLSHAKCQLKTFGNHLTATVRFSTAGDDSTNVDSNQEQFQPPIDDLTNCASPGGDMTDRFKYKVNALLGAYDPLTGVDNEHQTGNILNAMLTFPTWYHFVVIGKTNGQDSSAYVEEVQSVVVAVSGKDHRREWKVTPRGKNFTKITVTALVESADEVQAIYSALETLETTVMRY